MLKFRLSNGAAITGRGITAIAGAAIAIGACGEITGPISHGDLPVSAGVSAQAVPTVLSTSPANGETGVLTDKTAIITFSEPMRRGTINTSTITLKTSGGVSVSGLIAFLSGNTASFDPSLLLANGTTYVLTISTGVKNLAGTPLANAVTATFTTVGAPTDTTPPTVVSTTPASGAVNVATTTSVVLNFSEPMDAATMIGANIGLAPTAGGTAIAGAVSYTAGSSSATFTPSAALANSTGYTITVGTGAKDVAGNTLATTFTSSFTTAAAADVTPPTVTAVTPLNGATGVATSTSVVVTFSEAMNAATITTGTFTLTPTAGGAAVAATVSYTAGSNTATLAPSSALSFSTQYTVAVTNGAKDLANNGLTAFSSSFTTAAAPDVTPPTVTAVTPLNGATGVATSANVAVTFSEAMNAATINGGTFTLTPTAGGTAIAATASYSAGPNTATLAPSSAPASRLASAAMAQCPHSRHWTPRTARRTFHSRRSWS